MRAVEARPRCHTPLNFPGCPVRLCAFTGQRGTENTTQMTHWCRKPLRPLRQPFTPIFFALPDREREDYQDVNVCQRYAKELADAVVADVLKFMGVQ